MYAFRRTWKVRLKADTVASRRRCNAMVIGGIMQRVSRLRMSARDRVVVWAQWTQGASLSEIGRTLGRVPAAVFHVVRARGGVPPPGRFRSARALSVSDREAISRGLARGVSLRQLGAQLGRPTSTVSRSRGLSTVPRPANATTRPVPPPRAGSGRA